MSEEWQNYPRAADLRGCEHEQYDSLQQLRDRELALKKKGYSVTWEEEAESNYRSVILAKGDADSSRILITWKR